MLIATVLLSFSGSHTQFFSSPESPANAKSEQDLSTISPIRKNSKEMSKSLELKDTSRLQHEKLSLAEEVKAQKVKWGC